MKSDMSKNKLTYIFGHGRLEKIIDNTLYDARNYNHDQKMERLAHLCNSLFHRPYMFHHILNRLDYLEQVFDNFLQMFLTLSHCSYF